MSKCFVNFLQLIILVIIFICIIILFQNDFTGKIVLHPSDNISSRHLKNHRRFFNRTISLQNNSEDIIVLPEYTTISNDLIQDRLRSHAQFFNESSSSCNTTETLNYEHNQHMNKFVAALAQLRQQSIPLYSEENFNGRGIVFTVGVAQVSLCKVNLKMIERTETRLPIQIWYSSSELSTSIVDELLKYVPELQISACCFDTAQCRTITKIWSLNSTYVFLPPKRGYFGKHFPVKPAAILSATFAEVLFLDSDSYLVRDPEYLFEYDPMYHHFGALFFPDALVSEQPLVVWKLLNTTCARDEIEFESGAILVNKKRVWNALYITKLMNDQHEIFYKLLSKGDKDTFRLAFRFLHMDYYMVGILCSTGRYDGKHFCGYTMCKTDSMGRYIFINHVSLMKYVNAGYSSSSLGYTRIGLGDPYNHSFYMQYCPYLFSGTCLLMGTQVDKSKSIDRCRSIPVNGSEVNNDKYDVYEPLMSERSENSRMLLSETDNLMPGFVGSLLEYRKEVYGSRWTQSRER